jgi:hypothetical protein
MGAAASRVVFLLLAGCVLAYVPFLGGGLLTDDYVHRARIEAASPRDLLTAPDAFRFYRPLTQASLASDAAIFGGNAAASRAVSLVLHALVLAAAFALARLLLPSARAAGAAVVIFALTPKAHPIAVLWLSARGELLMSLFALCSVAAWIRWSRGGSRWWLAATAACYVLALSSKEAAILLPALLLLTPRPAQPLPARIVSVLLLASVGGLVFWWRAGTGALMPFSQDPHYSLDVPLLRLSRNAENYALRLLPGPLVLVVVCALALAAGGARRDPAQTSGIAAPAVFSAAWMLVFMAPVLGIVLRNELYLYLPAFGACLLAACVASPWIDRVSVNRGAIAAMALGVAGLGAYQVSRSAALHADLMFSARLLDALADAPSARAHRGPIELQPGDAAARRLLQDALGGYLPFVARRALGAGPFTAPEPTLRLRCDYDGRHLTLARLPSRF